jgi:hypothetical protein
MAERTMCVPTKMLRGCFRPTGLSLQRGDEERMGRPTIANITQIRMICAICGLPIVSEIFIDVRQK